MATKTQRTDVRIGGIVARAAVKVAKPSRLFCDQILFVLLVRCQMLPALEEGTGTQLAATRRPVATVRINSILCLGCLLAYSLQIKSLCNLVFVVVRFFGLPFVLSCYTHIFLFYFTLFKKMLSPADANVAGGYANKARGHFTVVSGGNSNSASGYATAVRSCFRTLSESSSVLSDHDWF